MSLSYNGTELQSMTYNGADVQSVTYNGVEVWSAHPPFLVRLRYDANETTHVKDLTNRYTLSLNNAGTIPAVADPFGGNNAMDFSQFCLLADRKNNTNTPADKTTWAFWIKAPAYKERNVIISCSRQITLYKRRIGYNMDTNSANIPATTPPDIPENEWHYVEVNFDGNLYRVFVDGILRTATTHSGISSVPNWNPVDYKVVLFGAPWSGSYYTANKANIYVYDFCLLNGVWHTENYNVPTAYI